MGGGGGYGGVWDGGMVGEEFCILSGEMEGGEEKDFFFAGKLEGERIRNRE